jgi:hypothetical protein
LTSGRRHAAGLHAQADGGRVPAPSEVDTRDLPERSCREALATESRQLRSGFECDTVSCVDRGQQVRCLSERLDAPWEAWRQASANVNVRQGMVVRQTMMP